MNLQMRTRLSTMMFLEYFIWGAWYVTLGTWLGQSLHFSGEQVGLAFGTNSLGAVLSPFFVGLMADELFANQKLLAALHAIGGVLLWIAAGQTGFSSMYIILLAYSLCYMPTIALSNAVAFRQMKDPKQDFGSIRVLGTFGWIIAGLVIGTMIPKLFTGHAVEATAIPVRVAAITSFVLAVYSLTLPDTPPLRKGHGFKLSNIFPAEAFSLFKDRNFAVFALASFLICIPLQFYYAFTNPFLNEIGVQNAVSKMTLGQFSELLFMLTLPFFFKKVGVKWTLVLGMLAWVIRYLCFGFGNADALMWTLYLGIVLHGICYDFFFVTGQVYVDMKAPVALRSAAQGLIVFLTYGIGMFVGSWICGKVVDMHASKLPTGAIYHDWRAIWMVPAVFALFVMLFFLLGFRGEKTPAPTT